MVQEERCAKEIPSTFVENLLDVWSLKNCDVFKVGFCYEVNFVEHFDMNRKNKKEQEEEKEKIGRITERKKKEQECEEGKMKNFKNRIEKTREHRKKRILDFISY